MLVHRVGEVGDDDHFEAIAGVGREADLLLASVAEPGAERP
jgi:hypothetical protein